MEQPTKFWRPCLTGQGQSEKGFLIGTIQKDKQTILSRTIKYNFDEFQANMVLNNLYSIGISGQVNHT
jgi:hypothetical protein